MRSVPVEDLSQLHHESSVSDTTEITTATTATATTIGTTQIPPSPRRIPRSQTESSPLNHAPKQPKHASQANSRPSLTNYLLGLHEDPPETIDDAWSVATKRRGVYNLIQVPTRLERLLTLGQIICLDEVLTLFTYLPLRIFHSVLSLPHTIFSRRRIPSYIAVDALHISLLIIASLALWFFDISWIYHNIRGQSVIKLYVVFNVIEIFDRLGSSFGIDVLDSLGWTTVSAVQYFTRVPPPTALSVRARALHGLALITRVAIDYFCALVYVIIHASLLLTCVVTLNVAINTQNNALLTLLVSNNFVELKGAVFKSFKVQNLFQIACSDAVERFQVTAYLLVMLVVASGDEKLFFTWGVIYACEIIVDWIKHAFVTKFNRISPRIYRQFTLVICDDISRTRASQSVVRSIGGSGVSKRIGFVSLPLAALVVRMMGTEIMRLPWKGILLLWLCLVAIKTALSLFLMGHAWRKVCGGKGEEVVEEGDEFWINKLSQVERYDLISKN